MNHLCLPQQLFLYELYANKKDCGQPLLMTTRARDMWQLFSYEVLMYVDWAQYKSVDHRVSLLQTSS